MTQKIVNFCYRTVRVGHCNVLRSRMQPFWLLRDNTLKCTGYGRDAVVLVETDEDETNLRANKYLQVIRLRPGVNCTEDHGEIKTEIGIAKNNDE